MIGNDIVDLEAAITQSNWRRNGFLEKVFSASERNIITASLDPDLVVWLFWSMKEAAYKAHQRKFSLPRTLNWKSQKCTVLDLKSSAAKGIVMIQKEKYFTHSQMFSSSLHTVATEYSNTFFKSKFFKLPPLKSRSLLLDYLSKEMDLDRKEFFLMKNRSGIPFLYYKNHQLNFPFSLSGHGRYSGFCHPLMNS